MEVFTETMMTSSFQSKSHGSISSSFLLLVSVALLRIDAGNRRRLNDAAVTIEVILNVWQHHGHHLQFDFEATLHFPLQRSDVHADNCTADVLGHLDHD